MEFSTHYLLMADHAHAAETCHVAHQTARSDHWTAKSAGLPAGPRRRHAKDVAKAAISTVLAFSPSSWGMERAGSCLNAATRDENRRTVICPSDRPRPGAVPPLECYLCSRRRGGAARLLTAGDAAGTDPARAYLSQSKQLKGDKIGVKGSKLGIRLLYYFGGFFVMTIGIALSVKSNLGVSPVSSIPYTMTCVWGIEMGRCDRHFPRYSGHPANAADAPTL